jgi:hypothetical protein
VKYLRNSPLRRRRTPKAEESFRFPRRVVGAPYQCSVLGTCKPDLALVSNDERKVWPEVFRFLPFTVVERQFDQPLLALLNADDMQFL